MKSLFLVRHAEAEKSNPGGDKARRLTPEGMEKFSEMVRQWTENIKSVDRLISSDAERAKQTTDIIAAQIICHSVSFNPVLYESSTVEMRKVIEQIPDDQLSLMIVGHNPTISNVIHYYSGDYSMSMSLGGLVNLTFDVMSWAALAKDCGTLREIV